MTVKDYFESIPTLDITAAHIGINKWNWTFIEEQNEEQAKVIMKKKRFDVLPIYENGMVQKFFSTMESNNYSSLNCNRIEDAAKIYYRTSMQDLLKLFVETKRHFFFLTDNREILGLVSIVNLSTQLVYNYFYHCLSELERNLANFFSKKIEHDELVYSFKSSSNNHLIDVYNSFNEKKKMGIDNDIYYYFYLQTYGMLIDNYENTLDGKERKLNKFKRKFGPNSSYTKIRNTIMHPSKGIPNKEVSINDLSHFLEDLDEINNTIQQ